MVPSLTYSAHRISLQLPTMPKTIKKRGGDRWGKDSLERGGSSVY